MTAAPGPARCRSCGEPDLSPILSLGTTPLADRLVTKEDLGKDEITAVLDLVLCPACSLVQITETVPPEILFHEDYPYFSSVSATLLEHSAENAGELIDARALSSSSLVIEIGSNDGYMLRNFVERGIPVLGVDPARPPAEAAIAAAASVQELAEIRARFLGRKGSVTAALRRVGELRAAERARVGQTANAAKQRIESWARERRAAPEQGFTWRGEIPPFRFAPGLVTTVSSAKEKRRLLDVENWPKKLCFCRPPDESRIHFDCGRRACSDSGRGSSRRRNGNPCSSTYSLSRVRMGIPEREGSPPAWRG